MVRDDRYKLVVTSDSQELYDLISDPYEQSDLLLSDASVLHIRDRLLAYVESLR